MSEIVDITQVGEHVEQDSIQGSAQEWRRTASGFLCTTEADYEAGIKALQRIKRSRRQWKELQQPSIDAAKTAWDAARATFNKIDDELERAYETIRQTCEGWIDVRREAQKTHLTATSQALEQTPVQIAAHLSTAFDAAMEGGDTAKAERILQQAAVPSQAVILDFPVIDAAALTVAETIIPKVAGASVAVPYTWELLDESKLPREFMTVDRKKVTKLVKAMGKDAQRLLGAGVLVRPDTTLRIREK